MSTLRSSIAASCCSASINAARIARTVQRLLRRGAITNLAKMLGRMHPADVAKVITHLTSPKEKREVFELVRGEVKRGRHGGQPRE